MLHYCGHRGTAIFCKIAIILITAIKRLEISLFHVNIVLSWAKRVGVVREVRDQRAILDDKAARTADALLMETAFPVTRGAVGLLFLRVAVVQDD